MDMDFKKMVEERADLGIPPLPLDATHTRRVCDLLNSPEVAAETKDTLAWILANRVPPGVNPAAKEKCEFLIDKLLGNAPHAPLNGNEVIYLLEHMKGGYSIAALIVCLGHEAIAAGAADALANCILIDDEAFESINSLRIGGNPHAARVMEKWAGATWFTDATAMPTTHKLIVYRVNGEVNTDDLSPAKDASTRSDIPLHALSMGESRFPGGREEMEKMRAAAKLTGYWPVFVADTLGTGSSRKSATNSLVWVLGRDMTGIPNVRVGGIVMANRIAPIFYNSFEDAGGLPLMLDVSSLKTDQHIVLRLDPATGKGSVLSKDNQAVISEFTFPRALADEYRAGGRLNLIIGRRLSAKAAAALGREPADVFVPETAPEAKPDQGYTLAQKLVGRACGKDGILPGTYCEPLMTTVGSQDTTGPMTRDELNNLACLRFAAPMVMQSFCHTAAYPNDRDKEMHATMPAFMQERGGVALKPGDGIIHSWLNRLLLPDTVGTGGDSHTRFPLGISFPAGSGLVALAAAQGFIPLEMPESVQVAFTGSLREGITLRDVVNAIPLAAIRDGQMDRPGDGNKNVFNGRIVEMEGLSGLTVEEAFELTNATAERSAAATTITIDLDQVVEYIKSNVKLIETMLADGYQDATALQARKQAMEKWLENPTLLRRDDNADFAATVTVDLDAVTEPVIACPNSPDLVALLSERAGEAVDEVFLGSCMSNIGHFRAAARVFSGPDAHLGVKRLWIVAPTRMDHDRLAQEGVIGCFEKLGARIEVPGCSLCMGNQARVEDDAVVFSTSTRNFDNRMGKGAKVYLGSGILAAVIAKLGKIPTVDEYMAVYREAILPHLGEIGKTMYFHKE